MIKLGGPPTVRLALALLTLLLGAHSASARTATLYAGHGHRVGTAVGRGSSWKVYDRQSGQIGLVQRSGSYWNVYGGYRDRVGRVTCSSSSDDCTLYERYSRRVGRVDLSQHGKRPGRARLSDQAKLSERPWTVYERHGARVGRVDGAGASDGAAAGGAALLLLLGGVTAGDVRSVGSGLERYRRPFHVYGFNLDFNGVHPNLDYLKAPTVQNLERVRRLLKGAARLGANTVRMYVELGDVMASPTALRPGSLRALRALLDDAQRAGLLVDVTGNLVWHPAPAWYDTLPEAERWRVQQRFWQAVAAVGAPSAAVLCYELTSEPAIGESPSWYGGLLVHQYVQYVVRELGGRDPFALARAWTTALVTAVRSQDHRHLVTMGLLANRGGPFDPRNVGDLLDLVEVHMYPLAGEAEYVTGLVRYYAEQRRPIVLGETFAFDRVAEESFLLAARDQLDGALSFFDGRAPEDVGPGVPADEHYRANLITFLGLRETLGATPLGG